MQKGLSVKDAAKRERVPQAVLRTLASPSYHEVGGPLPTATEKKLRQENTYWRRIALGAAEGLDRAAARGHARFVGEGLKPTDDALAQQLLRRMRGTVYQKPMTLAQAAKDAGVSSERARRLVKASGATPNPGKRYTIPGGTQMPFYAYGRAMVAIFDKDNASIVGGYMSAVGAMLDGRKSALSKYQGKTVTDVGGIEYALETDEAILRMLSLTAEMEGKTFENQYRIVPMMRAAE